MRFKIIISFLIVLLVSHTFAGPSAQKDCIDKKNHSPALCAIKSFYVFPGTTMKPADKSFLPNILSNHVFYKSFFVV